MDNSWESSRYFVGIPFVGVSFRKHLKLKRAFLRWNGDKAILLRTIHTIPMSYEENDVIASYMQKSYSFHQLKVQSPRAKSCPHSNSDDIDGHTRPRVLELFATPCTRNTRRA